jgi:hypothetical protein
VLGCQKCDAVGYTFVIKKEVGAISCHSGQSLWISLVDRLLVVGSLLASHKQSDHTYMKEMAMSSRKEERAITSTKLVL